jgi:hypothetical protein
MFDGSEFSVFKSGMVVMVMSEVVMVMVVVL